MLINGKEEIGKFDSKSDKGVFVGYSISNKPYRVFNKRTFCVKESVHVIYDESGNMKNHGDKDDSDLEKLL